MTIIPCALRCLRFKIFEGQPFLNWRLGVKQYMQFETNGKTLN
jgi:hypothetical protein